MYSVASNLNIYINLRLTLNHFNIKYSDIKDILPTKKDHKLYLNILFKSGKQITIPYYKFKLNKQNIFATTLAVSIGTSLIAGTVSNYFFKTNNDRIILNQKPENYIEQSLEESLDPEIEEYIYNNVVKPLDEINVDDLYNDEGSLIETIDETTVNDNAIINNMEVNYDDININTDVNSDLGYVRNINIIGDSSRGINAYENIINNYYNDILNTGITYGIDPSIIAALIMEEGGTIYNPYNEEDYYSVGLGCLNGSIWNNYTMNVYNYLTGSYESYTINIEILKNNPEEQIKVVAMMLQENAINYKGNLSAMLVCYNQGCETVRRITNQVVSSSSYNNADEVYNASDALLISENNSYTSYGNVEYTERVLTFLDYILKNETFGRSCATINTPDGLMYTYFVSSQESLSR